MQATRADEQELLARAQEGDTAAFDRLVVRYQKRFYNLAYRMVSNRDDALELTQEAFYQMYRNLDRFEARSRFSTWATRIVINLCMNLRRKQKRRRASWHRSIHETGPSETGRPLEETLPDGRHTPDERLHGREIARALQQALDGLPDIHRQVLVLRDVEGLSYQEIAAALEIGEGTVKSRLSRARLAIKDLIQKAIPVS